MTPDKIYRGRIGPTRTTCIRYEMKGSLRRPATDFEHDRKDPMLAWPAQNTRDEAGRARKGQEASATKYLPWLDLLVSAPLGRQDLVVLRRSQALLALAALEFLANRIQATIASDFVGQIIIGDFPHMHFSPLRSRTVDILRAWTRNGTFR